MSERTVLIAGGRVVDPANDIDAHLDVLIEDGVVRALGNELTAPPRAQLLRVDGALVTPGWIDSHVHFREPGFEHKETIASGSAAAAAGGFCAVATMPNTEPPPDTAAALADTRRRAHSACVRVYPIACVTMARAGNRLAPLSELAAAGAVAFSDDGDPVEDAELMRRALECSAETGVPVFPHEEVKALTRGGCMHQGEISARLGVKGMRAAGEEDMVARDIELVRRAGGHLHVAHISTAGTVELIRSAKSAGLAVTCEVLPHHFILTDETVAELGSAAKMSPPLRAAVDVLAIKEGLRDGTIDTIGSDHAPHTAAEKALPLTAAPFGIVGLETAVGLTLTYLVNPGILNLEKAVAKWTCEPARILKLPGGSLGVGDPGDVTVIDLEREWRVDPALFRSKSNNTPFAGTTLRGQTIATIVDGRIVYRLKNGED